MSYKIGRTAEQAPKENKQEGSREGIYFWREKKVRC
jgi:hypothetical protein